MQNNNKFYSWIPNLTGTLNFKFISDTIAQEDFSYQIFQTYLDDNPDKKCFLLKEWLFSDGTIDSKKGLKRDIFVTIVKNETELIAQYYEFLPERYAYLDDKTQFENLESVKKSIQENTSITSTLIDNLVSNITPDLHADIKINLNGDIKIEFNTYRVDGYFKNNIALVTYRAIKYILHKDVFHSEEEDTIIHVHQNQNCDSSISTNILRYLKSYERIMKDSINNNYKNAYFMLDSYEALLVKAKGIFVYLESYILIHDINNKKDIQLANNILLSMSHMIEEQKIYFRDIERLKNIKTFILVLIISTSILITGWIDITHKKHPLELFMMLPIPVLLSVFIFYRHSFKTIIYKFYTKKAIGDPETFINEKLKYKDMQTYKNRRNIGILVTIIFSLVLCGYIILN